MKEGVFYFGLGTLFTHELDAVMNHEWRVMPLIRALSDDTGATCFVLAHVPIFAIVVALVANNNQKIRRDSRFGVALFLVIHALLHVLFKGNPTYEFSGILSNSLIFGGAILGLVYLLLEWWQRSKIDCVE